MGKKKTNKQLSDELAETQRQLQAATSSVTLKEASLPELEEMVQKKENTSDTQIPEVDGIRITSNQERDAAITKLTRQLLPTKDGIKKERLGIKIVSREDGKVLRQLLNYKGVK